MTFGLLLTLSRGAWLSLTVSLGVVAPVLLRSRFRFRYLAALFGGALSLFLVGPQLLPQYWDKAIALTQYRLQYGDTFRSQLNTQAWHDFLTHPIFGIGPLATQLRSTGFDTSPHNFVLEILVEIGILGAFPFFLLLAVFLYRAWRNSQEARPTHLRPFSALFLAGIIASLVHGLLEVTFQGAQYSIFFFAAMSVVTACYTATGETPVPPKVKPKSSIKETPLTPSMERRPPVSALNMADQT
jgi:O-antigen ligase